MAKTTRLIMAVALVVVLIGSGINYNAKANGPQPVQLKFDTNKIMLRSGTIDVRFADNLKGAQRLPEDGGYYMVHFANASDKNTADTLIQTVSQGNILIHLTHGTYLCRLFESHMGSINSIKGIDWVGEWKPIYKISPDVYEDTKNTSTSTGIPYDGEGVPKFKEMPQPEDEYIVTLFPGENVSEYIDAIENMGGIVRNRTFDRMFVHIDENDLSDIAALDGVYFIERRYLQLPVNDNATWIVQSNQFGNRKVFANGITGAGENITVSDTGIDMDHLMFWDSTTGLPDHTYNAGRRKVLAYYNWYQTGSYVYDPGGFSYYNPGDGYFPKAGDPMYNVYDWDIENPIGQNYAAGHGSHTSGTAAGEWELGTPLPTWGPLGIVPTAGYDFYEGNAYGAKLVFQDLGRQDSPYVYAPPDLNDPTPAGTLNGVAFPGTVGLFTQAMVNGQSFIHSNSWGGGAYGYYSSYSQDIDEMMWQNQDFLVIFSNGNDGPGTTTITPPATAKDCLSIGAAETTNDGYGHNSDNVAIFSSWGPTGGWGRVKPDVCAPGYYIFSGYTNNVTDGTILHDDLQGVAGTSMAAPGVAGCCALVREYFRTGNYNPVGASTGFQGAGGFTPTAAMMKSIIVQSAEPMIGTNTGGTIPGDGQGWGRVLLDNALYFSGDTRNLLVDDDRTGLDGAGIAQPFFKVYTVTVAPGQPLDVTLAYSDPPGTAGSSFQMVNYMYVEVDHPNGVDYYLSGAGNFSNGESVKNPGFIYPDTVQKVRINNPDPGTYTIFVVAFQTDQVTPGWNVQPFALSVCGNLLQSQGYVQFDEDFYQTSDTLNITLSDADLAGNGTATVTVTSANTSDSEDVTVTETSTPGIFTGTHPCDPVAGTGINDGTLYVSEPDTLTVSYADASPAGTRTDTAIVDQSPPENSDPTVNACNGASAQISWTTNEPTTAELHYGPTTSYGNTMTDAVLQSTHSFEFDGLQQDTTYYFEICSTDQAGNTTCSGPYSFTTPDIYVPPQYHTGYMSSAIGVILDDDDMWTGHDPTYGLRHGVFQFDLSGLPAGAKITSAQIKIFKQADFLDAGQPDTWSCNLIDFSEDLFASGTYSTIHNASIVDTVSSWTTAELLADAPGTVYTLLPSTSALNEMLGKGGLLTFRLDGATSGDSLMSWDTGYRQDAGSLSVCYKPQLIISYTLTAGTPANRVPSLCPLAKYNITRAQDLKEKSNDLLSDALGQGLDTSEIEELLVKADQYLETAQKLCAEGTNCVAGNWNVLKAIQLYNQAIDKLEELLGI